MVIKGNKTADLSPEDFNTIREMIYNSIGVNLTDAKKALTVSRLSKRLRELEIDSIGQYIRHVRDNPAELDIMFNLITTNVTKFFREVHHFDYLVKTYLPYLESKRTEGQTAKKIRAWSAGCSTGEEPYTLGMVLHQYFKAKKGWTIKILASDINTETLNKAGQGIYSRQEIADVPYEYLKSYFKLGTGSNEGFFKVKDEIKNMILFRRINLTSSASYPISEPLNLIFCRNVFIYFDKETQGRVLDRYYEHLLPGGLLFLGHSESINQVWGAGKWRLLKHTVYEKVF